MLNFVNRVFWLNGVKEALGYIPQSFNLTYHEIKALVILKDEADRKLHFDNLQLKRKSESLKTSQS